MFGASCGGAEAPLSGQPDSDVDAYVGAEGLTPDGGASADVNQATDVNYAADVVGEELGDTGSPGSLCDELQLGANASLEGYRLLSADSPWNQPAIDTPIDPASQTILTTMGLDLGVHPDFGCCWGGPFGIPYVVVDGEQTAPAPVSFTYATESDPGPYPIPLDPPIEGGPDATGDRHILVLDCAAERLYEIFDAWPDGAGGWTAASGAVFDLVGDGLRAAYCTSADAGGLPILPGLVRYDEAAAGVIAHALRFTVTESRRAFVRPPASHWASSIDDPAWPPMGMRVRLHPDDELAADGVDVAGLDPIVRVIVTAMQEYGMIVADNGGDWFVSGAPDPRWDDEALVSQLGQLRGRHFDVLQMDGLVTDYSLPPGDCVLEPQPELP